MNIYRHAYVCVSASRVRKTVKWCANDRRDMPLCARTNTRSSLCIFLGAFSNKLCRSDVVCESICVHIHLYTYIYILNSNRKVLPVSVRRQKGLRGAWRWGAAVSTEIFGNKHVSHAYPASTCVNLTVFVRRWYRLYSWCAVKHANNLN